MDDTSARLKSGAIITISAVVFTGLIFYVGDFRRFARTTKLYKAHFADLQFVSIGQAVTVAGVRIGRISEVVPPHASERRGLAMVRIEVDNALQLRDNAALILRRDGLLGERFMELSLGAPYKLDLEDETWVLSELESAGGPVLSAEIAGTATAIPWVDIRSVVPVGGDDRSYRIYFKDFSRDSALSTGSLPDVPMVRGFGLVGHRIIPWTEVRAITASGGSLTAGNEIVLTGVEPTMADMGRQVEAIRPQIEQTLRRVRTIVTNVQFMLESGDLREIFHKAEQTIVTAENTIKGLQEDVKDIKVEVTTALKEAQATIAELRTLVEKSGPDVKATTEELRKVAEGLGSRLDEVKLKLVETLASAQGLLVGQRESMMRSIDHIEEATWYAKNFARKLNENPSVLLFGAEDTEEAEPKRDGTKYRKDGRLPPFPKEP